MSEHIRIIDGREKYFPDEVLSGIRDDLSKLDAEVTVPGSKSITNRALLMAALSESDVVIDGVLFSDDSRHFISSLKSLLFDIDVEEQSKIVKVKGNAGVIPAKSGTIDVGSAGTAARFLTAMLALSDGEYVIKCSKQMEKRPMKPLFDVLESMGAEFTYLGNEGFLPVKVRGNMFGGHIVSHRVTIDMDISKSTQFLSAMLMVAPVMKYDVDINITSEKKTGAYIEITMNMLKDFGIEIDFDGENYHIKGGQKYSISQWKCNC